ncbi:MAG: 4-(cytidine 5'-diphospho)-2-C-methyl-D-erythritol kinase [Oscillospiraceae bacterium]|nr:4-(cytidine 5'-diphospho)-2-C-methyl-D-erythritol kinase [Oscillospiraceae bacterium]
MPNVNKIVIKAPAKINLTLFITGKRGDFYHNIESLMQQVSLFDTLTIEKKAGSGVEIFCPCEGVPQDGRNICAKAAENFFSHTGKSFGLEIHIDKKIPIQAGLAGGSADAAACLKAFDVLAGTALPGGELLKIAAETGSDVPFCLSGPARLVRGRGEELEEVPPLPDCHIVIVKPSFGSDTGKAYALFDALPQKRNRTLSGAALCALERGDLKGAAENLSNDFEGILDIPEIFEIKRRFSAFEAAGSLMSGSGTAVYGLFYSEKNALSCKTELEKLYEKVFICKPLQNWTK